LLNKTKPTLKIGFVHTILTSIVITNALLLTSCSQEKNTLLSKSWHNLNARDNSYFLAKDRTKELETEIDAKIQNDYNKVLFPIAIIDTNQTKGYKDKTDDIIKKASKPINYHKNSVYVDNCYVLVGKSRVLRGEWKLAAETFKFVNAQGESEERYESLIQLMRLFMLKRDFRSAAYIMDYLDKQPIESKKNKRDFNLTKAQLNRHVENYFPMAEQIQTAIPLMTGRKEKKAKLYFILGQIFQKTGVDSLAFINYKKAIRSNPSYELSFYSKLYLAQVASLSSPKEKKKTEKYFKKLLKDKKNLEYKDKIYYEMALYEYKQKNIPKTINYLEKSVYENRTNKFQKGASYLKLGEIYYTDLKNYEIAKLYYDSTIAVWDRTDKQYKEIAERQKVLEEFVKNLLIVRREDSLQRLAKMDSATLSKHIDKVIAFEEAERIKKEKQAEAAKKRAADIANTGPQIIDNSINPADPSSWYFYNPTALQRGAVDFTNKWGNRKLEDNWRRQSKEAPDRPADDTTAVVDVDQKLENPKESAPKDVVVDKTPYMVDIPNTPEKLEASHIKIQDGVYNLGRIYHMKLSELKDAINTFEDFLKRYPDHERVPEILYFLHIIANELKDEPLAEAYKNRLLSEYPKSMYAKMLVNPNYLKESKEENKMVSEMYKQAFNTYERHDYIAADSMLSEMIKTYPDNENVDRMKLLKIIITGKTKNALVYQTQLQAFIDDEDNEKSPTLPKAKELLATSQEYMNALSEKGAKIKTTDVRYSTNTSKPHYFVAVYDSKKAKAALLQKQFINYNKKTKPDTELLVETAKLSDSTFVVVVKTFDAMYPSKQYREEITKPGPTTGVLFSGLTSTFYITEGNYLLFFKDKNVDTYLEFFKNNY